MNEAFTYFNKVSLGSVDEILAISKLLVKTVLPHTDVEAASSCGESVMLSVHPAWRSLRSQGRPS
eukprot:2442093-Amphidinium_carterae.1